MSWLNANSRCPTFLGGVLKLLIPNNLRSAVKKADRHESVINESYLQTLSPFFQLFIPGFQRLATLYRFLSTQAHHPRQLQTGRETCIGLLDPIQYLLVKHIRNGPVCPVAAGTTDAE